MKWMKFKKDYDIETQREIIFFLNFWYQEDTKLNYVSYLKYLYKNWKICKTFV